jgi:hypothetical protein
MAFTAFVSDVCSRRIVGLRTSSSMPTELTLDALDMGSGPETEPANRLSEWCTTPMPGAHVAHVAVTPAAYGAARRLRCWTTG